MRRIWLFVAVVSLAAAACGSDQDPSVGAPDSTPPADGEVNSIQASDQTSDGSSIIVEEVTITGSQGFIALHEDNDGAPGTVVGHAAIPEGTSVNVAVETDEPIESGDYWPMLHIDAGEVGTYEFPGADVPATDDAEQVVMVKITVTVEDA